MASWVKGLLAGLIAGIAGTLLVVHLTDGEDLPQELADALHCSAPIPQTAAGVHHGQVGSISWFAATHADRIAYVGCDLGPGTRYLHYPGRFPMSHVLATLDRVGAVCVKDEAFFDGALLNGRDQLEELCSDVGGRLAVLSPGHGPGS
jgi:hypothetical protein